MTEDRRPATDDEIRELMLRRMLPATHGTEDEQKAAAKAAKAAEPTAEQKREKLAADAQFDRLSQAIVRQQLGLDKTAEPELSDAERAALEAAAALTKPTE